MLNQLPIAFENSTSLSDESRRIITSPIHVSESTFLGGLSTHIHRWFRLTPSFAPDLVREMLDKLEAKKSDYILDPFSGVGTTSIEATLEGFDSIGIEINPFLHFVNKTSLNWALNPRSLLKHLEKIKKKFSSFRKVVSFENLESSGYSIPPIHNPTRWWLPDVLVDLLVLKRCLNCIPDNSEKNFFILVLAGVLVPDLTNVTMGRLQLHFIKRDFEKIDVLNVFNQHAQRMINDLSIVKNLKNLGRPTTFLLDSTNLKDKFSRSVDCVITSPPYPNRYSYVWNTRPHLYLFDFFKTANEASSLDKNTIGGTWGTATSELQKGVLKPLNKAVEETISKTVLEIREKDQLMANYAVHYFNRLTKQIIELEKIGSSQIRIAYVVGNSWLKGVYVETDYLLAEILERLKSGYKVKTIHRFRKRHSGKNLFESIVYAGKK